MRQLVKAAALVAGMMVFSSIGFAQCKIVVIDMQEAVTGSAEGKVKQASFDAKVKDWTDKLDKIKADIDTAQTKLKAQASIASQTVLNDLNKTITDKNKDLTRMSEDAQKDVDDYRDSLLGPVMMLAEETMNAVAAEKNYSIVYDSSSPNSNIVYASKDCDITKEVQTRMNAKGSTSAAAPAKPAATGAKPPATAPATTAPKPATAPATAAPKPATPPATKP